MTVLSVLLILASLYFQRAIYLARKSGQRPKTLPTLKKRGDQSDSP